MEWLLLLLVAAVAAAYVGWPRGNAAFLDPSEGDRLRQRRSQLMLELSELDADLAQGRISDEDRRAGRRAVAPELRELTERLRDLGEAAEVAP